MPKVKKHKTLVSDFDYLTKLSKLREEVPAIAHNLYPLYTTCSIHLREHNGDYSYYLPDDIADLERIIYEKIENIESRKNLDTEKARIEGAGIFVELEVEGGHLFASVGVNFGYQLL